MKLNTFKHAYTKDDHLYPNLNDFGAAAMTPQ